MTVHKEGDYAFVCVVHFISSLKICTVKLAFFSDCPEMQLPVNLDSIAQCGIMESCVGIKCCLDVSLGSLNHNFSVSMIVDPCHGQLKLQFGNWKYSRSLSRLDIGVNKEVTIGNFVSLM